ncbi:sulfurtransferase TusA family protein [Glaesserella parasuis]|uniref:sulfurtransferase TusA family protein n=1 Tax=Glaesserella parasuis TaxID=738 RepID=UPI0013662CB5|nr:sulfurtransferase TusA family protein [Glaesserella parasuis]MDG6230506.1 sulfurtransferase TusA family protein [Glaesserella parasuis]MDO9796242.1 sulfurtransferase TusA family protein [Glaesserella parasuis]MDP0341207.1 sulfurtransferase TusA family protein [Glaesserella parasuis]MDP0356853.1 sulfurtransferase TusA family protein [Glaesserella parasuis]MWQ14050.1 sulfurtransferase TusA family protein [Glaesserella parasuis]
MVNYSLDLTAYRCPLPLLSAKRGMLQLKSGESLKLHLNKDVLLNDIILLCQEIQCELKIESETEVILFIYKDKA